MWEYRGRSESVQQDAHKRRGGLDGHDPRICKCGEGQEALKLNREMQEEEMEPAHFIFVAALNACSSVAALEEGRYIHKLIIKSGYKSFHRVVNCLVDMYAKCGSIEEAWRVFNKMARRHMVAWNVMILGYVKCGEGQEALELSRPLQQEEVDPKHVNFMAILNACGSVAALEEGRRVHRHIIERGYNSVFVASCLVDMYVKCGSMEDARRVFNKMTTQDIVVWRAMLAGYARHRHAKEALEHFERMCEVEVVDGVTFISLLSACSHVGLVDEGLYYFESMRFVYRISPTMEHYTCVVNLLGRVGRLHEADDLIMSKPCKPDAGVWMSLLKLAEFMGMWRWESVLPNKLWN